MSTGRLFSTRLDWQIRSNPLSRVLREKRRLDVPVCDLTASNPTRVDLPYPDSLLREAFAAAAMAPYAAEPRGLPAARAAVAAYYTTRALAVDPDDVLLTCSTSEAYAHLFRLLADPGDAILVPHPCYPLFDYLAGLDSVRLVPYPLAWNAAANAWHIDLPALAAALAAEPRARAILVVSPSNPTGATLDVAEVAGLAALVERHGVPLIVDEVFADYPLEPSPSQHPGLAADRVVPGFHLNGLSKISGLPQMKLGWIVVAGPDEFRYAAMSRLELIGDTFLSVGGPVQHAAATLLGPVRQVVQPLILERVQTNLVALRTGLADCAGLDVLPVQGGWYAMLRLPTPQIDETVALDLLLLHDTLVHPGYLFDLADEHHLVLSLLPPPGEFLRGLAALRLVEGGWDASR